MTLVNVSRVTTAGRREWTAPVLENLNADLASVAASTNVPDDGAKSAPKQTVLPVS